MKKTLNLHTIKTIHTALKQQLHKECMYWHIPNLLWTPAQYNSYRIWLHPGWPRFKSTLFHHQASVCELIPISQPTLLHKGFVRTKRRKGKTVSMQSTTYTDGTIQINSKVTCTGQRVTNSVFILPPHYRFFFPQDASSYPHASRQIPIPCHHITKLSSTESDH